MKSASQSASRSSAEPAPRVGAAENAKRAALRTSDGAIVELLQKLGAIGVFELASALQVTATAVRQRLERLMREGIVSREVVAGPVGGSAGARRRGRPAHVYRLTEKGIRAGGDNFRDLAVVLWQEIRRVESPEVRRGLLSRVGSAMAGFYRHEVAADTLPERLENTVRLLRERQITCGVEFDAEASAGPLAVLTSHVCPYPEIAEQDRGICAAERMMLQDLLGAKVALATCRLDGAECCRFAVGDAETDGAPARDETVEP
jgi:predicted ArsR family transcriptional regulator